MTGIVGVLVLMAFDPRARMELWLGLLSWMVVLTLYFVPRWRRGPAKVDRAMPPTGKATRVLVLANKNVSTSELFDVLRRVDARQRADYFICVPVNPVDTGQAERTGPVFVLDATVTAAQERLDAHSWPRCWRRALSPPESTRRLPAAAGARRRVATFPA